jgi:hypothetical protein
LTLAEKLRLRRPPPVLNWTTVEDIRNLLDLAGIVLNLTLVAQAAVFVFERTPLVEFVLQLRQLLGLALLLFVRLRVIIFLNVGQALG